VYQQRLGIEGNADEKKGLPPSHKTVAERLQTAGYRTAMVGKWHLGFGQGAAPNARGFDKSLAFNSWSIDYYSHRTPAGDPGLFEDGRPVDIPGYSTDVFADRAVEFILSQDARPFFLYLAFSFSTSRSMRHFLLASRPAAPMTCARRGPAPFRWRSGIAARARITSR
jgi:arylsulfatase A-like enzyme